MKVLITLFAVFAVCFATSFHGYKVLRVTPANEVGVEKLHQLCESPEAELLKEVRGEQGLLSFDVMVSPNFFQTFLRELEKHIHTAAHLIIPDLQELIDQNMKENALAKLKAQSTQSRIDHSFYRTLDEIYAELNTFAATYSFMSVSSIGQTFEGRDMMLMKISTGGADTRPVVWIDCGIHAREWVSPASCLFYIDSLSAYGTDPTATALLDTYDFYILTVFNPDGYSFTWTDNRMWRKNRYPSGTCFGIDMNRNFATGFGGPGSSDAPCSDTYHGPVAFSELESQAVRDYLLSFGGRLYQYYDMHSYSQLWMYPNGYTNTPTPDDAEQFRVAEIGVQALTAVHGTPYAFGPIATTIYLASGGTVDWVYDPVGVVYSYTLEFRDTGTFGFQLPPGQILPNAEESWAGVVAAINAGVVTRN